MKKHVCLILLVLLMLAPIALAQKIEGEAINFAWDANMETDLAGYRIYRSNTPDTYVFGNDSPNLVAEIPCQGGNTSVACTTWSTDTTPLGTWFWVITAYDTAGQESEPSETELSETVVAYNPPPSSPVNWRFDVVP